MCNLENTDGPGHYVHGIKPCLRIRNFVNMQIRTSSNHNRTTLINDMTISLNSEFSHHYRIPNTLSTNETARHIHNPVYNCRDTRPPGPSKTYQQRPARDGKKIEHAYEVIPPAPTTPNQHNSKQGGNTAAGHQVKTHNTGKPLSTS